MLDEYQRTFCEASEPRIRLLAPAGAGKTSSLLWRCRHIYERKGGSARFLVVTFTRAARDELRKRLAEPDFREMRTSVEIATLNGWGFRRVKQAFHMPQLRVTEKDRSFCFQNSLQPVWRRHEFIAEMVETHNAYAVGRTIMNLVDLLKSMGFVHDPFSDEVVQARIAELRALNLLPILENAFCELDGEGRAKSIAFQTLLPPFLAFWKEACESLIAQSLFTLEDQKYVALLLLQKQLEAGKRPVGGSRITHVLVDEFQDINPLDLALIKVITDLNNSELTIVGDDDQAIFEWRGASFRFILNPEQYFRSDFKTYLLQRNYRCPSNLLAHALKLIELNKNRVKKNVVAVRPEGARIEIKRRQSFEESIDEVMGVIRAFRDKGGQNVAGFARLALISRKRAQLIPYQILLAAEEIPFCAAEDLQIFLSEAFERLIDALNVALDAKGRVRTKEVVSGIVGLCDLVKRYPLSKSDRAALEGWLTKCRPRSYLDGLEALARYRGPLKGQNEGGAMSITFANAIRPLLTAETVSQALDAISEHMSGLDKDYGRSQEDIFYSDPPFFYLSRFAERYGDDFEKFIDDLDRAKQQLARLPPDEEDGASNEDPWAAPIHLMTALRAKGKEFDTVVLLDVNDGIWPSVHAETPEQKEQERRLFYVAMTRAKRHLIATVSDRIGDRAVVPSPFLAEAGLL